MNGMARVPRALLQTILPRVIFSGIVAGAIREKCPLRLTRDSVILGLRHQSWDSTVPAGWYGKR